MSAKSKSPFLLLLRRFAIINHVVHLVNRDYEAMALDYYELEFLDEGVDVSGLVPDLVR